jgi:hypothetical protein
MPAAPMISVNLAQSASIMKWKPTLGDFVVWHGWFTHWFGVVSSINADSTITITKAGIPVLLFGLDELEQKKNTVTVATSAINRSRGGKYAVMQALPGTANVWYV